MHPILPNHARSRRGRSAIAATLLLTFLFGCSHDGGGHRHPVARAAAAKEKGVVRDIRKKNKLALQERRKKIQTAPKPVDN